MKVLLMLFIAVAQFLPAPNLAQDRPHPIFSALSEQQVRGAFAEYETKAKRGEKLTFGLEKTLNFPVQGMRGVELLTLGVGISPPISQVRKIGYEFGKAGRAKTAADREDVLKRLVERMKTPSEVIPFYATTVRNDWSTSLDINFALANEAGITILPYVQPNYDCPERDLLCHTFMSQTGRTIEFPLLLNPPDPSTPSKIPFVTDQMRILKLVVSIGDTKEELEFNLNSIR